MFNIILRQLHYATLCYGHFVIVIAHSDAEPARLSLLCCHSPLRLNTRFIFATDYAAMPRLRLCVDADFSLRS